MLFGDQRDDFPESLLQWLTSNFVSKSDLQTLLRDLELQILKNITLHMSVTNQKLTSEVVTNAVTNAGISGITEAVSDFKVSKVQLKLESPFIGILWSITVDINVNDFKRCWEH